MLEFKTKAGVVIYGSLKVAPPNNRRRVADKIPLGLPKITLESLHLGDSMMSKAIEKSPTNSLAYFNRAVAYIKLNENEKGTNDLRISARLGNKNAQQTLKDNNLDW